MPLQPSRAAFNRGSRLPGFLAHQILQGHNINDTNLNAHQSQGDYRVFDAVCYGKKFPLFTSQESGTRDIYSGGSKNFPKFCFSRFVDVKANDLSMVCAIFHDSISEAANLFVLVNGFKLSDPKSFVV